jgi:hypothetical protein
VVINRRASLTLCAFALGVVATWSGAARADASASELVVARQLFRDAVELERARAWEKAAGKLRDAIAIKETPGLRFHLAHCEVELGLLVEALLDYDRAGELIFGGVKAKDVELLLTPASEALKKRIPTLTVEVGDVEGASVELDTKPVSASAIGRPTLLNPTSHQLVVRAPGRIPFRREFTLAEGQKLALVALLPAESVPAPAPLPMRESVHGVEAAPAPARAPLARTAAPQPASSPKKVAATPSDSRSSDRDASSTKLYVLIVESTLTLTALGVGVGFQLARAAKHQRWRRDQDELNTLAGQNNVSPSSVCGTATAPLELCRDSTRLESAQVRDQNWAIVGFVGAGVGAATMLITAFAWPSAQTDTARAPALELLAGGSELLLRGHF